MSEVSDYPALRKPRLRAGVGVKTATVVWMIAVILVLLVPLPWGLIGLPIGGLVHVGLRWMFAKDHKILSIYSTHAVVPNTLHAGSPSHGEMADSRPSGYAKNIPLR